MSPVIALLARAREARRPLAAALALAALLALASTSRAATHVEANLSAGTVEAGESVTLIVVVTDPGASGGGASGEATGEPQFALPAGLSALGSSSGQTASVVSGRFTTQLQYRYEIGADRPGRYAIGPIQVRVGRQVFESEPLALAVTPASASPTTVEPRRGGVTSALLTVDVEPRQPYVGQLVQLRLRFLQTVGYESRGDNVPPTTTGFWAEGFGDEIHYRARLGDRGADVTERRQRIYPLAPGPTTIGSAEVSVAPTSTGPAAAFGGPEPRTVVLTSDSVRVRVLALPPNPPPGFGGAVGALLWSWNLDRGHTTQDQAITLDLDVRGTGNLPLLKTPPLSLPDFEIFPGTVDDSFAPPGELAAGRRRFVWTLMPRHTGTLHLQPPALAWFDPASASYRQARLPSLEVDVLGPGGAEIPDLETSGFPDALARDPARPGTRPSQAWLFAIGGLLLGLAARRWRGASAPDAHADERRFAGELLATLKRARAGEFWRAANHALEWLEQRGTPAGAVREHIAAVRYGGRVVPEDEVRRPLAQQIAQAVPTPARRAPARALAVVLALAAVACGVAGAGQPGPDALAERARVADALARSQRTAAAASAWEAVWRESPGDPALAARLGWAALRGRDLPAAAVWVLRGRGGEPRSRSLAWIEARVRDSGGLAGAPGEGAPLRSLECAALAFALAFGAVLEWPRRWGAALLLLLALAAVAAPPLRAWIERPGPLAVVRASTPLAGQDVTLDPGQVVRIQSWNGRHATVLAGRDLDGDVDPSALAPVAGGAP